MHIYIQRPSPPFTKGHVKTFIDLQASFFPPLPHIIVLLSSKTNDKLESTRLLRHHVWKDAVSSSSLRKTHQQEKNKKTILFASEKKRGGERKGQQTHLKKFSSFLGARALLDGIYADYSHKEI